MEALIFAKEAEFKTRKAEEEEATKKVAGLLKEKKKVEAAAREKKLNEAKEKDKADAEAEITYFEKRVTKLNTLLTDLDAKLSKATEPKVKESLEKKVA